LQSVSFLQVNNVFNLKFNISRRSGMKTVGINGFGRIGRTFLRAALGREDLDIVAVNDLTDAATLAHLLKHDSLWGAFPGEVRAEGQSLVVNGRRIAVLAERDPAALPWAKLGVDIVVESTGRFTDREKAKAHIESGGAKKVLISAPAKGEDLTVVMGVNHDRYDPSRHDVISNGSCTTNGLAPVALALHRAFGIERGLMLTTHAYTNSQALHDEPEKDLRGARAAALSIVPYPSGAAKAIGKVIPELDGRLSGFSLRVPVPVVSVVDLTVDVMRNTSVAEVNAALKEASEGYLEGILGYSEEPLVSKDYEGDDRSSVVDALSTMVMGERMVKVLAWYDNEWGFSRRLADLAAYVGSKS
jgi:glyceraldehyde 3-phosphate dehydrogenase